MSDDEDIYRARAEVKLAAGTDDMKARGRLVQEAMRWHNLALEEHDGGAAHDNDDAADPLRNASGG